MPKPVPGPERVCAISDKMKSSIAAKLQKGNKLATDEDEGATHAVTLSS